LMDLNLPGDGGEVATTTILAAHPEIAVLVLTMHADDAHLRHALNAGALATCSRMQSRMRSSGRSSL
jgi:DNA-binding NarL/FixJ family response regulator